METPNRRDFLKGSAVASAGFAAAGFFPRRVYSDESAGFKRLAYRDLGSTGYKITEIGFGCMNMRDPELVHAAIDKGINYIDTAYVYMNGQNEEIVGQVMKTKRDKVFLTTKVGLNKNLQEIPGQIKTSLKRLQTDHVDLLLFHHGGDTSEEVLSEDYMKVMDDARQKGYTRFVGFSTHTSDPNVYDSVVKSKFWEAVLLCYNYQSPPSLTTSIEKMRKAGIAVIAMKTLLNFAISPRKPLPDIREDKNGKVTYAQALLKWVLSNSYVDLAIPGMTAFEHLDEDLAVMGTKMSYEDHRILYRFSEHLKESNCLSLAGCTGCMGKCPKGVEIHELTRCLGYVYGYGDIDLARENYSNLPSTSKVTVCADCEECVVKCMNGLNLTHTIQRAKELFA